MGENLKKFVDLYSKKAEDALKKSTDRLAEFTSLREKAIAFTTKVDSEYESLGKFVEAMFPLEGGVNDALFARYSQLEIDKEERAPINKLYNLKNAPTNNQNAIAIKEKGGEAFFNEIRSEIGAQIARSKSLGSNLSFDKILGKNSQASDEEKVEEFNNFVEDLAAQIERPRGVLSGPELYMAMVESGDPTGGAEEAQPSPINEAAKKEAAPEPAVSAVNPEEAAAEEAEANLGQVTALPPNFPSELQEEKQAAINLNLEQPNIEVAQAPINLAPVEKAAPTFSPESTTAEAASPVSPELKTEETTAVNINLTAPASPAATSAAPTFKKEKSAIDVALKRLSAGEISPERVSSINTSSIKESETSTNLEESVETAATSTVINSEKEISSTVSEKALKEKQKFLSKYLGINLGEEKKAAGKASTSGSTEAKVSSTPMEMGETTESSMPMVGGVELTKSSPKLEAPIQAKEASTPITQASSIETKVEEKSVEMKEVAAQPSQAQPEPMQPAAASNKGMEAAMLLLETRLARLEYLLSNPLDVKIIE